MSTIPSFLLLSNTLPNSGPVTAALIDENTQRHLRSVRISDGEILCFLDGAGKRSQARCVNAKKLDFEIVSVTSEAQLTPQIHLYLAPPKGEALWEAITQMTEAGAMTLSFLQSDHTQGDARNISIDRAQRVSDAACAQCSRSWRLTVLPEVKSLAQIACEATHSETWVADEELSSSQEAYALKPAGFVPSKSTQLNLVIGPEGGWSEYERKLVSQSSCRRLGLGPLILRVPTACVAALHQTRLLYNAPFFR